MHKGVSQGCTLLPWLLNVFVDNMTREARREFERVKLSTGDVGVLLFAEESEEGYRAIYRH